MDGKDVAFNKSIKGEVVFCLLNAAQSLEVFINKYISYLKWEVESPVEVRPLASSASRDVSTGRYCSSLYSTQTGVAPASGVLVLGCDSGPSL